MRTQISQSVAVLTAYRQVDSALGLGFIHGDAYPGNTLWDGERVRLGDWDEVARGPRELDLAKHTRVRASDGPPRNDKRSQPPTAGTLLPGP